MASAYIFRGDSEQGGIEPGCKIRVESLPQRHLVWQGVAEGDEVPMLLDPGKYIYSVSKESDDGPITQETGMANAQITEYQYVSTFLHEVDESQWKNLFRLKPKISKQGYTSSGVKWFCQGNAGTCRFSATSAIAMVLHEASVHLGIDKEALLNDPKAEIKLRVAGRQLINTKAKEKKQEFLNTVRNQRG